MKKNTIFRIAAVVLMCALVTACFASSTFAKYTSQAKGETAVTVAKWEILAGNNSTDAADIYVADGGVKVFDLTTTIVDTVDGNADTEVATGLIAPGTKGAFELYVKNNSEVDAAYTIDLDETAIPAELLAQLKFTYYVDGAKVTDLPTAQALDMNADDTVKVEWVWAFEEDDDVADTYIGHELAATAYDITATLTVDQLD